MKVGISNLNSNQKIDALTRNEAQRVALAKVILKDPPLISADERTDALDLKTSEEIMPILLTLRAPGRIIICELIIHLLEI